MVLKPIQDSKLEMSQRIQKAEASIKKGVEQLRPADPAKNEKIDTPKPDVAVPKVQGQKGGPDMESFQQGQFKLFQEVQQKLQQVLDKLTGQTDQLRKERDSKLKSSQTQEIGRAHG